jgi:hypothetical protein
MQRMKTGIDRMALTWILALTAGAGVSGCLFAAGAGAAGAIYYTDRGAESLVKKSVDQTFDAAKATFEELGIQETKRTQEADERGLEGKDSSGERDLSVKIERQDESTKVQVVARKSAVTWDKDYAKMVLEKIVARAN